MISCVKRLVLSLQWKPCHVMIDKCCTELNALVACTYHFDKIHFNTLFSFCSAHSYWYFLQPNHRQPQVQPEPLHLTLSVPHPTSHTSLVKQLGKQSWSWRDTSSQPSRESLATQSFPKTPALSGGPARWQNHNGVPVKWSEAWLSIHLGGLCRWLFSGAARRLIERRPTKASWNTLNRTGSRKSGKVRWFFSFPQHPLLICLDLITFYVDPLNLWTDHGMPSGQTQDGFWGTNNTSETMFRSYNTIFRMSCGSRWWVRPFNFFLIQSYYLQQADNDATELITFF